MSLLLWAQRPGNFKCVDGLRHIVHTNYGGTVLGRPQDGRHATGDALFDGLAGDVSDHGFTRYADQDRQAQCSQLRQRLK